MGIFSKSKSTGTLAIDGNRYTQEEYRICQPFVRAWLEKNGYTRISIKPWETTGAIAGFAWIGNREVGVEFYMHDLLRGEIRNG